MLKNLMPTSGIYSPNRYSNLNKEELDCLKVLSNNENIIILESDKGNTIVILNRCDYVDRMKELLSDSLKFQVTGLNNDNILRNLTNVRASFKGCS